MRLIIFYSLLMGAIALGQSQSYDIKNSLEFQIDNDFPFATDRYYTTGSFIRYRRLLKNKNCDSCKEQATVGLQHIFFTPTNRESVDVEKFDRPYAGFLGLSGHWTVLNNSNLIDLSVLIGVTGKISGAEGFQNLFHSSGGLGKTVQWTDQIANSVHVNFSTRYVKEWPLISNPLGLYVSYGPELTIGTKDVFLRQAVTFYFGKRNSMNSSVAYNQLGDLENEIFIGIQASHSYVAHNATLEGSLINDRSLFTIKSKKNLLRLGASAYFRLGRNDIKAHVTYQTPETESTEKHLFIGLSYAINF